MKIRIGVAGEGERREAGFADDDAELLLELADQGRFGALARLDLAAGKFPQARHCFAGGALGEQHAAVRVHEGAGGNQDEVCAHDLRPPMAGPGRDRPDALSSRRLAGVGSRTCTCSSSHSIAQVISTSAVIVMVPTSTGTAILAAARTGMSAMSSIPLNWLRAGCAMSRIGPSFTRDAWASPCACRTASSTAFVRASSENFSGFDNPKCTPAMLVAP